MPPKGYRHISLREKLYLRLEELAQAKGLGSVQDAIALLLEYHDIHEKIREEIRTLARTLKSEPQ